MVQFQSSVGGWRGDEQTALSMLKQYGARACVASPLLAMSDRKLLNSSGRAALCPPPVANGRVQIYYDGTPGVARSTDRNNAFGLL
jgi:hypothetical protein